MKKFNSLQIALLKIISSSSGKLDTYTLFKRSKVNFSSFIKAFHQLVNDDVLIEKENYVSINMKKMVEIREGFSVSNTDHKAWRNIPVKMLGQSIDSNSLYIPSRSRLDKKTFIPGNN